MLLFLILLFADSVPTHYPHCAHKQTNTHTHTHTRLIEREARIEGLKGALAERKGDAEVFSLRAEALHRDLVECRSASADLLLRCGHGR